MNITITLSFKRNIQRNVFNIQHFTNISMMIGCLSKQLNMSQIFSDTLSTQESFTESENISYSFSYNIS